MSLLTKHGTKTSEAYFFSIEDHRLRMRKSRNNRFKNCESIVIDSNGDAQIIKVPTPAHAYFYWMQATEAQQQYAANIYNSPYDPPENLTCPFCGGGNLTPGLWSLDSGEVDSIECDNCFAGAPLTAWNKRAVTDAAA